MQKTKNPISKTESARIILKTLGYITRERLHQIGFKNSPSPIYQLRKEGWKIETKKNRLDTVYYLIQDKELAGFDKRLFRLIWLGILAGLLTMVFLYFF